MTAGRVSRRTFLETTTAVGAAACLPLPNSTFAGSLLADQRPDTFPLIAAGRPAALLLDVGADSAVHHAADGFARDLERVSGRLPKRFDSPDAASGAVVIIGVLGQSRIIDELVADGRVSTAGLNGEWEAFRQIVVDRPFPRVSQALLVVGSDRRGAVFGTYDISERIGVSPWHWFADVPVRRQENVFLPAATRHDQPKVRYRGFFINDEDPCLRDWARKKFGGVNSKMYAHVFEVLLRMKGNYLWPAMWAPKAFAADDPQSMVLADAMGVVMGNSHHEPMLRAQDEWHRNVDKGVTGGKWDYITNAANLRAFWRGGIERMMSKGDGRGYESLVTIGMRGDGDEAMAEGTATALLERIVADQRKIIAAVTGTPAHETPQVWALYKEVQDYYDHGMQVPDDVTLLFADDNWGQIRRLPKPGAASRSGGYGIYYHFDYVGVPRNYKWINTNQIEKIWQQMNLAYERDARNIWIANVGDIKPMEYPLSFFLKMAWNPEAMTPNALANYPTAWAQSTFGSEQAVAIGEMISAYSQRAARRKPELIDQDSFQLGDGAGPALDGGEFGALVAEWDVLEQRMLEVRSKLHPDQLDAYYQLLEYPISAMTNLYRLYYAAAWNKRLASHNDARANFFADEVEETFRRDRELMQRYHTINSGKWDGMMSQVHMSYVIWNDPTQQSMPSITRVGGDTPTGRRGPKVEFVDRASRTDGAIDIPATNFNRTHNVRGLSWTVIPNLGRTGGAVIALPQGCPATSAVDEMRLEYDVTVQKAGQARLTVHLAPTLDTLGTSGIRIAVALDESPAQILTASLEPTGGEQDTPNKKRWARAVCDNAMILTADVGLLSEGEHTIKLWRLDDNVVLQKLTLYTSQG